MNVRMIKNSYKSKTIRKTNYQVPREKKMRLNTTIIDTTMTPRFSIIEIKKEFDMFDNSTTSSIHNINITINYISTNYIKIK